MNRESAMPDTVSHPSEVKLIHLAVQARRTVPALLDGRAEHGLHPLPFLEEIAEAHLLGRGVLERLLRPGHDDALVVGRLLPMDDPDFVLVQEEGEVDVHLEFQPDGHVRSGG